MGKTISTFGVDGILSEKLTHANKNKIKYEREKNLYQKELNNQELNENLGSYRASMGGQGINPYEGSAVAVQKRFKEDTKAKNNLLDFETNYTIKNIRKTYQGKNLLNILKKTGK